MTRSRNDKLALRKSAIERLIKGEDGKLLLDYLGSICLCNLGVPSKDLNEYAYNEGKRSVFLAILQMSEMDLSNFIHDMVKEDGRI